jgi:tRNA dimethylallyltransferase
MCISSETLIYYGLEYKFIALYLTGKISYQEMVSDLEIAIHQFAKRQMTWFRGMERRGIMIHWIDGQLPIEEKVETIMMLLKNPPLK